MPDSLYDQLKAAGCQLDNHESDLYVLASPEAQSIIKAYQQEVGIRVSWFISPDNRPWIEVPFHFSPWWQAPMGASPNRASMNPNCDGSGPHAAGQVRVLPTGGDSNAILCAACHRRELAYRRERNQELGEFAQFDLPAWDELAVYEGGA